MEYSGRLGRGNEKDIGDDPGEMESLSFISFGTNEKVIEISSGDSHNCALFESGQVKCWGWGYSGQLGQGNGKDIGDDPGEMEALSFIQFGTNEKVIEISSGGSHNCALFESGRVKCWGWGDLGQLGQGNSKSIGDDPGEMESLSFISFGTNEKVIEIGSGEYRSCALFESGRVKCWGWGYSGQLGQGNSKSIGDNPGEMESLSFIQFGTNEKVIEISSGGSHNCALFESGRVKCWGRDRYGQLGQGNSKSIGDNPGEMESLSFIQFGTNEKVIEISSGGSHNCALFESGRVKCWGRDRYGQLGQGNNKIMGNDPGEMESLSFLDFQGLPITCLSSGRDFQMVLFSNGLVKGWGENRFGQLGVGTTKNMGDDAGEMESLDFIRF